MSFYLYSPEDFPAKRKKNPAFQDTPEYLKFNNFVIYDVKAHVWTKLARKYERIEFADFMDKRGTRVVSLEDEMADAINLFHTQPDSPGYGRGVVVVDEKTYANEAARKAVEEESEAANRNFRAKVIAEFEMQLQERQVTGKGRAYPTPYEEECYEILDMPRPHSAESILAQRRPGLSVAQEIVSAIRESSLRQSVQLDDVAAAEAPVGVATPGGLPGDGE